MDAFEQFLTKSDLESWNASLNILAGQAGEANALAGEALVAATQAITVSCYTQWLGSVSGDTNIQESSRRIFERLATALEARHRLKPSEETTYGVGIIAAWRGHRYVAEQILKSLNRVGQHNILLLVGRDNAESAARLKEFVSGANGTVFVPLVYTYCDDLLQLGALDEVSRLIEACRLPCNDSMTLDLLGKIYEQKGDWEKAGEIYARSSWPRHAYCAAVCSCISQGVSTFPTRNESGAAGLPSDVERYLSEFSGEITRRELIRTTTFVNACRWNQFDDWKIHYELGKLSFSLRRHAEAEQHFRAAFERCPEALRSAVGNRRFTNLTWVSTPSLYQDLNMMPETLEYGRAAIAHAPGAESVVHTATWIALETENRDLVKAESEPKDLLDAGDIESQFGDRPEAIKLWRHGLGRHYDPRLLHRWIALACACRFEATMTLLIDNICDNSSRDFAALWELGKVLLRARARVALHSDAKSRLDSALTAVAGALEEMSHDNFQNLIRAYEFFTEANRQDVAESLLSRAAELAESPEEFLELAVARRKVSWFSSREGDQIGITSLWKADREARERLERLQIAREYCYYGDLERARVILSEERIRDRPQDLTPAEYAQALASARYFEPSELKSLHEAAFNNLTSSRNSGLIKHYPERFVDRLSNLFQLDVQILRRRLRESAAGQEKRDVLAVEQLNEGDPEPHARAESQNSSTWQVWQTRVASAESLPDPAELDGALQEIRASLEEQDVDMLIALWEWVYGRLTANLRKATQVRPEQDQDVTPISKSGTIDNDWRAQDLTDYWKQYIHSTDDAGRAKALREIEAFNERESELLRDWERRKEEKQRPLLAKALAFGRLGQSVVEGLLARNHDLWPVFWDMEGAMAADLQSIMRTLHDQLAELTTRINSVAVAGREGHQHDQ